MVFPHADVKVFLVASIEERARRRREQLLAQGVDHPLDELMADIAARDAYDSGRAIAPLRKADDAVEIDTTGMSIPEVISTVCALVEAKRAKAAHASSSLVAPTSPAAETGACGRCFRGRRAGAAVLALPVGRAAQLPAQASPPVPEKWAICRMVRSPLDTGLYRFAYSFLPPLWRLTFRMKIRGSENIPLTGPVLLVSNHRSNLDPFFIGVAFPRQVHFMAKAELWKVKVLGRLIDRLGAFPVSRGEADRTAVKRALEMLGAGAVVGMFPEGHRQRSGQLGGIQAGVSLFSLREGVVTVPMVMDGTERVVRKGLPRFPRVRVAFGPPLELPADELPRAQRGQQLSERLTAAFQQSARLHGGGGPLSPLEVKISESAGFCWGVERALELASKAAEEAPGPCARLGPLIHNPGVIADLERRGVNVVLRAGKGRRGHRHPADRTEYRARSRSSLTPSDTVVVDATCRFVKSAQEKAAKLHRQGYFVIILGETDHPEVLALRSYAGEDSLVVESPADLPEELPSQRVGVVVQTTQSQERLAELVEHLAPRVRELLVHNTICSATEQRQTAAMAMADQVDAVVVVGGRNSGNTRRLAELCAARQPRTYHVESADELDPAWFRGLNVVGVTAGASTPPEQIKAVADRLAGFEA